MPKSFCSGKVIFQDVNGYTLEDVIFLLENREFSEFRFNSDKGYALIDSEAGEMQIEYKGSDNVIPEETVRRMLAVLEHIEECIEKANDWIRTLHPKDDRTFERTLSEYERERIPHQFQEIFEVSGINFGNVESHYDQFSLLVWNQYRCGHNPNNRCDYHPKKRCDHRPKKHCGHHPIKNADYFSIDFDVDFGFFHVKFDYKDMLPYEAELRVVYGT